MTDESSEDSHLLKEVESCFTPTSTGQALHERLAESAEKLAANLQAMQRIMPYLTNVYYEDRQWQIADREMRRLEKQRRKLRKEHARTRELVGNFQRSVVTTHIY